MNQPSGVNASRVWSGALKYPAVTVAPATCSRPTEPSGTTRSRSSTTRIDTPGIGAPTSTNG